jgi:hypothetical protein
MVQRFVALAVLMGVGCAQGAEPPERAEPGGMAILAAPIRFLGWRLADLAHVVELNAGQGHGFKLGLSYGVHFFGLGRVRAWRAGLMDRRAGYWRELDDTFSLFPLSLLGWPVRGAAELAGWPQLAQDARFVATAGGLGVEYLDRKEYLGDPAFIVKDTVQGWRHARWGDSFPIGGEVFLGLVGLRLQLRPLQLADFALGFVGLDLDPWLDTSPY